MRLPCLSEEDLRERPAGLDYRGIGQENRENMSVLAGQFCDQCHASFAEQQHVTVRALVPKSQLAIFRHETQCLPSVRVTCGDEEVSWEERKIVPAHSLHRYFLSEPICGILSSCLGRCVAIERVTCWTSTYKTGEYISKHRDNAGDIQLIVALKAPAPENGGWLNLESRGRCSRVFLNEGDALCFAATEVAHFTSPLIGTGQIPDPVRTTAVARYFLAG
jgi:hypothetical protein